MQGFYLRHPNPGGGRGGDWRGENGTEFHGTLRQKVQPHAAVVRDHVASVFERCLDSVSRKQAATSGRSVVDFPHDGGGKRFRCRSIDQVARGGIEHNGQAVEGNIPHQLSPTCRP